jgi:hypothetical protein
MTHAQIRSDPVTWLPFGDETRADAGPCTRGDTERAVGKIAVLRLARHDNARPECLVYADEVSAVERPARDEDPAPAGT